MTELTAPSTDSNWQAILDTTRHMLVVASEQRWDELPAQAKARDSLIRQYFSSPISVDNALRVHEEIRQLLAADEQILGQARKAQAATGQNLKSLHAGHSAAGCYAQTAKL